MNDSELDVEPPVPGAGAEESDLIDRVLSEATVVARAQDGDLASYEWLVRTHEAELFRLAFRMLGNRGDAEDVVQETFVLAWRRLPTLIDPQAFHAWIYHIATNCCLNLIRLRTRRKTEVTRTGELEAELPADDPAAGPEAAAQLNAQLRGLDAVLTTLPAEQRACWVLKELHDLSYPEIAYAIGVPVSTVRGRIARARHTLARGMSAWR